MKFPTVDDHDLMVVGCEPVRSKGFEVGTRATGRKGRKALRLEPEPVLMRSAPRRQPPPG
jgi:hypothetical protein